MVSLSQEIPVQRLHGLCTTLASDEQVKTVGLVKEFDPLGQK